MMDRVWRQIGFFISFLVTFPLYSDVSCFFYNKSIKENIQHYDPYIIDVVIIFIPVPTMLIVPEECSCTPCLVRPRVGHV